MKNLFKSFATQDGGAVTTEFIVLFAAVVGLGVVGFVGLPSESVDTNSDPDKAIERFVAGFD